MSVPEEDDALLDLIRRGSKPMRPLPTGVQETGRLPRAPRAALFDVYGTLLSRVGDAHPRPSEKRRAVEALARKHRLPVTADRLESELHEMIAQEHSALRARGVMHPEVRIESIWGTLFPGREAEEVRVMVVEYELAAHPAWPMPGWRKLLSSAARQGLRLGIVSNAQFYTPLFLRALLTDGMRAVGFSPELCLYSCDFAVAKPDQALFDGAAERLARIGIGPEETVMIGNSQADDVSPAARARFMTVLAALDRRSYSPAAPGAAHEPPDAVVRRLGSLATLFLEHGGPEHVHRPDI